MKIRGRKNLFFFVILSFSIFIVIMTCIFSPQNIVDVSKFAGVLDLIAGAIYVGGNTLDKLTKAKYFHIELMKDE